LAVRVKEGDDILDKLDGSSIREDQLKFFTNNGITCGSGNVGRQLLGLQLYTISEYFVGNIYITRQFIVSDSRDIAATRGLKDLISINIAQDSSALRVVRYPDGCRGSIQYGLKFINPIVQLLVLLANLFPRHRKLH